MSKTYDYGLKLAKKKTKVLTVLVLIYQLITEIRNDCDDEVSKALNSLKDKYLKKLRSLQDQIDLSTAKE